jgi:hypothetical protein
MLHLDHRVSQARETNGRVQLTFAHGATDGRLRPDQSRA